MLLSFSPRLADTTENVRCQGCPRRGSRKIFCKKNFRSLDTVQMNGRYAVKCGNYDKTVLGVLSYNCEWVPICDACYSVSVVTLAVLAILYQLKA